MSGETLPVVHDRRKASAYVKTGATLPPGATEVADAERDPGRTPVVLVHGTTGVAARDWFTLAPQLHNLGRPVFTFSWEPLVAEPGGPSATTVHTDALERLVDEVAERTGSRDVDLVGHSWGAVLARALVRRPRRAWTARRLVGLAPTYGGTTLLGLSRYADHTRASGARDWLDTHLPGWREQSAGSEVLTRLGDPELDALDAHVAYTSIVTRYDQVVTPYRAALDAEPRAEKVLVQDSCVTDFSDHVALVHDAVALWHVVRALEPEQAGRRPRGLVLPLVGGPL